MRCQFKKNCKVLTDFYNYATIILMHITSVLMPTPTHEAS